MQGCLYILTKGVYIHIHKDTEQPSHCVINLRHQSASPSISSSWQHQGDASHAQCVPRKPQRAHPYLRLSSTASRQCPPGIQRLRRLHWDPSRIIISLQSYLKDGATSQKSLEIPYNIAPHRWSGTPPSTLQIERILWRGRWTTLSWNTYLQLVQFRRSRCSRAELHVHLFRSCIGLTCSPMQSHREHIVILWRVVSSGKYDKLSSATSQKTGRDWALLHLILPKDSYK